MPEVAVDVWYKVGARDEAPGRTGFAHLFEHMMFQGTKHIAEDKHFEFLQKAGASNVNGSTSHDRTNYFEVVPVEPARAGAVARERAHGLPARPRRLQGDPRQPARRGQERAPPALRERPAGLIAKVLLEALYPPDHPYHHQVIGSMEDLTAASVDDVKAFFRTYYAPGQRDAGRSPATSIAPRPRQLVEKYFGPIPAGEPITRRDRARGPADGAQAHRHGGEDPAAPALRRLSVAGELRARRSRARPAGHRARQAASRRACTSAWSTT